MKKKIHPNDACLKDKYVHMNKKVNNLIKLRKINFCQSKFEKGRGNSKAQWRTIDEIIGTFHSPVQIASLNTTNGDILSDPARIANEFNKYFIEISQGTEFCKGSNIKTNNINFNEAYIQDTFFLHPATPHEVLLIISSLKNATSAGSDGIKVETVKRIAGLISNVICYLLNMSFEHGIFPEILKTAIVTPLLKKGDSLDPGNYRPISILSIFSKVYEKAMVNRMVNFLNKHNFFSGSQFGFREGYSTEDALLNFLNEVYHK